MKISKKATSIAEAMIVMLIVVSGVTGMYKIFSESTKLSGSTSSKIQAIQIAKQGIEAATNIRDTNWVIYPSDIENCWNSLNYNALCIGDSNIDYKIKDDRKYIIFRDQFNRWILEDKNSSDSFGIGTYLNDFKVGLNNGIYTQSGITENLRPLFTREIVFNYLNDDGTPGDETSNKIELTSLVQWRDSSGTNIHKVELKQILTNWKK